MIIYERELQIFSTESKIIEIDLDFAKKYKIEVGEISELVNHNFEEN